MKSPRRALAAPDASRPRETAITPVSLITGTSTGIGYATALELAGAGHEVYAAMRDPGRSDLAQTARSRSLEVRVLEMDVNHDQSVERAIESVFSDAGRIDVLVNNAGLGTAGPIEEVPLDHFRLVMETNYFGALRCIKAVLPHMRQRARGTIVNVSSVAGRVATAPQGAYAASKFALEALSEILAQETAAHGIRVVVIEPGVIKTPIFEKAREVPVGTAYPQERRLHALNLAAWQSAITPEEAAVKIREAIETPDGRLRHPIGRDARPFMAWRKMLTDEEWIERHGEPDDEAWSQRIKLESGVDIRPFLKP